jgi:hypothetical protein
MTYEEAIIRGMAELEEREKDMERLSETYDNPAVQARFASYAERAYEARRLLQTILDNHEAMRMLRHD